MADVSVLADATNLPVVAAPSAAVGSHQRLTSFFAAPHQPQTTQLLALPSGGKLDLAAVSNLSDGEVTAEMLVTVVGRLREVEAALAASMNANNKRKAAAEPTTGSKSAKASAASTPATVTQKRKDMIIKKVMTAAKQSLKGVKFFSGCDVTPREAKAQDLMSKAEFEAVFGGAGTLIQPTPQNKPNSKVIIRRYDSSAAAVAVLGDKAVAGLKGELWVKGGAPTRGFGSFFGGGGGGFAKGRKLYSVQLELLKMEAKYSEASQQLNVSLWLIGIYSDMGYDESDGFY